MMKDKILGALIGSAVGDALGRATEFMSEKKIVSYYGKPVTDYYPDRIGLFGEGEWTDDTYLMLAIANSLLTYPNLNIYNISENFLKWYKDDGRDCGNLTGNALNLLYDGFEPLDAGKHAWEMSGKQAASNGGLMRNTCVPLFYHKDLDKLIKASQVICQITHFDNRCVLSTVAHSIAIKALLDGDDVYEKIMEICGDKDDEFDDICEEAKFSKIKDFKLDGHNMGYTYLAFKVGLCALLNYEDFETPIIEIINKGGDSDTNACVAGGLLGAKYGLSGIPKKWQDGLVGIGELTELGEKIIEIS